VSLAVQTGADFTWCQSPFPWINADTTTTVSFDLLTEMSCAPNLADVKALYVFFNAGTHDLDNVRAE
jgi:mannan endo-1,4-beta-mannosidase